jgi:hypothetical protein
MKLKKIKSVGKRGWFSLPNSLVHNKQRHIEASKYGKTQSGLYAKDLNIKIVPKKKFVKLNDVKQFYKENPGYKLFGITKPDKNKMVIMDRGDVILNSKTIHHELNEIKIYNHIKNKMPNAAEKAHDMNPVSLFGKVRFATDKLGKPLRQYSKVEFIWKWSEHSPEISMKGTFDNSSDSRMTESNIWGEDKKRYMNVPNNRIKRIKW